DFRELWPERVVTGVLDQVVVHRLEDEYAVPSKRVVDGRQLGHDSEAAEGKARLLGDLAQRGCFECFILLDVSLGEAPPTVRLGDGREPELSDAAAELGVRFLEVLDSPDGGLEKVEEVEPVRDRFIGDIVRCLRLHRPQVVVCFGPEGAYGHPDHKVVSRLTVQACTLSGDPAAFELEALALGLLPWSPSKLYFQTATVPTIESLQ